MKGKIKKEGKYELFETTKGHQILTLNKKEWYAIVKGKYGHILVKSDSDHEKKKTLQEGVYYLADFKDNPEFNDTPHLFLKAGKQFREFILPNELPTSTDHQKKVIIIKDKVSERKIKKNLPDSKRPQRAPVKRYDMASKSKKELYEMAKKRNIPNRSSMSKEELVKNLK
jgi:hypothetical protein